MVTILHCEHCNCTFPRHSLDQHQNGRRHRNNVAANGLPNFDPPQEPPPPQPGPSNAQLAPLPNALPPSGSNVTTPVDSCITVSDEGGLNFLVVGTGDPEPSFSLSSHTVLITKTEVKSKIFVKSWDLAPLPNSQFFAHLDGNSNEVQQEIPLRIVVEFQAPHAGCFCASLKITFIDETRPSDPEFTVTRGLCGRTILAGGPTSNGGPGITVLPESGLEFWVERARSDVPFATQILQFVINNSTPKSWVALVATKLHWPDSSVLGVQPSGSSKWINSNCQRVVTFSFTPQQDGLHEATLELTFYDGKRKENFTIERTLRGVATQLASDLSTDEGEELLDVADTGISVSDENGVNFGIVERTDPNGPFATPTSSLTIRNAEGFPAVTLVETRIQILHNSGPGFIAVEGDTPHIQPGAECTVHIQFNPDFDGSYEATLELVFYDSQRSARFVVSRALTAIAVFVEDHRYFEPFDQEINTQRPGPRPQVPPQEVILLSSSGQRRKSKRLPEYELPPEVQSAVGDRGHRFDFHAPVLLKALNPTGKSLNMETYSRYFNTLLSVEDGHQQREMLDRPPYRDLEVEQCGRRYSIEIVEDDHDEDLPEVIVGDYFWLDDVLEGRRYEACATHVVEFVRRRFAVLRISLILPKNFELSRGPVFSLRFRLNRITLRRQYHALETLFTPQRRLLFPSPVDIKPIERRLSTAEIENLHLSNQNIRDDAQQLLTVVSILQQPKGTVPFIIFGPPGTGKTTTVVESIIQLTRHDVTAKILACTPSNAAADLLIQRLAAAGLDSSQLFRLNAYSRYEADIPEDVQLFSELPNRATLLGYQVVLSTCSSAARLQMLNIPAGHFSHIVIDEAAQAEEPLAMIPIILFSNASTNVILAGDPRQLGPVIKSSHASKAGLGKSYLERLMDISEVYGLDKQNGTTIVDLQRNRRSHGTIIAWPNRYLYEDRMRACASKDVTHTMVNWKWLPQQGFPIVFHGIRGRERRAKHSYSYFNDLEASTVVDYCRKLIEDTEEKIYPWDIGVIAPYRAQVRVIRKELKLSKLDIEVGSVEQFQGQERKVIIFATTRSNSEDIPRKALGFVTDRRRMNVAITRAQALLIVIGDPETLHTDELWRTFVNYMVLGGGLKGKGPSWDTKEVVAVPGYDVIPRRVPVYGEGFMNGKSDYIYRYHWG